MLINIQPFIIQLLFCLYALCSYVCSASNFKLKDYVCTENAPASYTLALLDRSRVLRNITNENVPHQIRPFIHASAASGALSVTTFPEKDLCTEHFVVQLMHKKSILRSAFLTESLLKNDDVCEDISVHEHESVLNDIDGDDEANDSSENDIYFASGDDFEDQEYEYSASMILFPIANEPDKMLAYLLGNWVSLLNTTSIFPLFGLKIVTSIGVASTALCANQELSNIKEIGKGTLRHPKPMRGTEKQQKGLCRIRDFELDPASNGLESVRLQPIESWGKALLEGDDLLKFRLNTSERRGKKNDTAGINQKSFNSRQAMSEVANEIYNIYLKQSIHKDFLPYLDEPMTGDIADLLNQQLEKKWQHYFEEVKLLYVHWTFWFRTRMEANTSSILKKIKTDGYNGKVEISGHVYKSTQLIRSLPMPISLESDGKSEYYWFDRERWYRIPASRFEVIEKRISDITVKQDDLFLPDYVFDSNAEDYKELAYNKAAVNVMRAQIGVGKPLVETILLDRENISLGGREDKFEFADILMQQCDGKYFLIHVKRERAQQIDHHRTQVERCALYLGENFDRGNLPGLLVVDILRDFYRAHITLPKKKNLNTRNEQTIETEQKWSSNFRDKMLSQKKVVVQKGRDKKRKRTESFLDKLKNDIFNVRTTERLFIKNIVTSDLLSSTMARFEPYEDTLCRCLDALEDFVCYGNITGAEKEHPIVSVDRIEFVKSFFERTLNFLEKHASLVKNTEGVLSSKERDKIVIVLAIIGDGSGREDFHRQQLWGVDQTRKLVEKQGFKFNVVFIKDATQHSENSVIQEENREAEQSATNRTAITQEALA
ncbi:MAG: TIGR04141 family sporadically distributed protein [Candidatus Paracaedibacteraceae bacterium]|nr:TIGR04141 family sporadically distributed protein [Candidatus Paracaedibacteraceae bacterium]